LVLIEEILKREFTVQLGRVDGFKVVGKRGVCEKRATGWSKIQARGI